MNWKLLFKLSLFGLFMAFATVYFMPVIAEPFCWIAIFVFCAAIIARFASGKYFLHGFVLAMLNSLWMSAVHVIFFSRYFMTHTEEAIMMTEIPLDIHPRAMMLVTGLVIGILSGLILGLFSLIGSRVILPRVKEREINRNA